MQIADRERRDLGAAQPDLQSDRQDRPVAQSGDGLFRWHVEQFARLRFREGEGRTFVAIDRRPLDLTDRVAHRVVVADQMLVERGQRRQPPADRRRRGVLGLAHVALPGDHRLVVGLAQFLGAGDRERAHEMLHVEPVGAPGARALLLLQPDFFFGDFGELVEEREPALVGADRDRQGAAVAFDHPIPPIVNFSGSRRPVFLFPLRTSTPDPRAHVAMARAFT